MVLRMHKIRRKHRQKQKQRTTSTRTTWSTLNRILVSISILLVLNCNLIDSRSISLEEGPTSFKDVIETATSSHSPSYSNLQLQHQPPLLLSLNDEIFNKRDFNATQAEEQAAGTVTRTANIVDLVICILSVVGALTIIFPFLFNKHSRKLRHALIVGLATSDLVARWVVESKTHTF